MKVLKIGATWCKGCKVMGPRWKEIEGENPWLITEYHDYDNSEEVVKVYNITAMPSFIFLSEGGEELLRLTGEVDKIKLVEVINEHKDK
ncbi:MAG: Thioredoxin [Parcubacteria group bacterium ADurb.Bin216]|nr:MAG: Thioredoxin [Parcubacteria group bacterium ADurb.Bin216]